MKFLLKRFEDLNIESILVGIINAIINVLTISSCAAKSIGFILFMFIYIVTAFATAELFKNKIFNSMSYLISYFVSNLIFIFIKFFFLS